MAVKKERYKGPVVLGELEDAEPVKKDTGIDLTAFKAAVQRSWDKRQAKDPKSSMATVVPVEQSAIMQTRFRTAAKEMGLGVAIEVIEAGTPKGNSLGVPAGSVRLVVDARKKKTAKAADAATAGSTEASPAPPAPAPGLPKPQAKAGK